MPGPITVILESDPSPRQFVTAQAPRPIRLGVRTDNCKSFVLRAPRDSGRPEAPCPHSQTLLPAGEGSPSSLLPGTPSAHTQLFIASGNTPTARPPPPFNRHRAPAHTHTAGALHRRLPRPPPTHPSQQKQLCPHFLPRSPEGHLPRRHEGKGFILPRAPANPSTSLSRKQAYKHKAVLMFQGV